MTASQPQLFDAPVRTPPGFRYQGEIIDRAHEQRLLAAFETLSFTAFEFHGFTGKRRTIAFGNDYDFSAQTLHAAPPLPDFLLDLRRAAAAFAGIPVDRIVHAMITDYPPGAPIGWHRDRPEFEEVIGVSLASTARLRFRRRQGTGFTRIDQVVEPRSAYLISGEARSQWEHSIPPGPEQRYSVTFRTLRP
jgi:alkylated DNA repair dioxygenase AlkB